MTAKASMSMRRLLCGPPSLRGPILGARAAAKGLARRAVGRRRRLPTQRQDDCHPRASHASPASGAVARGSGLLKIVVLPRASGPPFDPARDRRAGSFLSRVAAPECAPSRQCVAIGSRPQGGGGRSDLSEPDRVPKPRRRSARDIQKPTGAGLPPWSAMHLRRPHPVRPGAEPLDRADGEHQHHGRDGDKGFRPRPASTGEPGQGDGEAQQRIHPGSVQHPRDRG